jgi:hypothetical protein
MAAAPVTHTHDPSIEALMKRRLFAHERELRSWRSLTLTTHRVIHLESWPGFEGSTSILLSHLQWTRIARSSRPLYVVIAGLLVLFGVYARGARAEEVAVFSFVAAVVMGLAYLATRRGVLVLASGDGRVTLPIDSSAQGRQQARDFLDTIEDAAARHGALGQLSASA